MSKRSKLGIRTGEATYSACKIHFNDPARADYLTFDSMVQSEATGRWVHLALPVVRKKIQPAILAGIPRGRPTFEDVAANFIALAHSYGIVPSCEQGMSIVHLAEFLLDDIWAGGIEDEDIQRAWSQIQRIIYPVLGTP